MEIKNQKILKRPIRSFNKFGMNLLKFFVLFLFLFITSHTSAQIISTDQNDYDITVISNCNANPYIQNGEVNNSGIENPIGTGNFEGTDVKLPAAVQGKDYCFQIPLTGTLTWSNIVDEEFNVTNPCPGEPTIVNGTITWAGGDICIPAGGDLEIEFDITDDSDNTHSGTFQLPVLRGKPIKIVYVLDRSGSMGWTIPLATGTSPLIRWDVLKDAVVRFTDLMDVFTQFNDSISVTYFSSDVITTGEDITGGFITTSSETVTSNTLETSMSNQTPSGSTDMGFGLLNGRKKLQWNIPIDATKFVLLFTDGEQNGHHKVLVDGVNLENDSLLNNSCNPEDSIKYLTIGIGTGVPALDILGAIANANNGGFKAIDEFNSSEINTLFEQNMRDILKGNSPQIVARKTGKLINGKNTTKFSINGSCNKIVFDLSYIKGDLMNLKIEKDGDTITSAFRIKSKPYYKILSLNLPYKTSKGYIYSEGEWTITVTGNSEEAFNLTCIADDHYLNYDCETDKNLYTVGDSIKFSVDLSYAGKPLTGETDTVKAVILKPGDDIGHLLATYATPEFTQDSIYGDSISGYYQKYTELMYNNSDFYTSLLPDSQIVILEHLGDGHYTGLFDKTDLTGIYQIYFLLKGEIEDRGTFIREEIKTTVFEYGNTDNEETVVDIDISQGKPGNTAVITVKPINKFGYYMGPGWLSKININYKKKTGAKFRLIRTKVNTKDNTSISEPIIESMIDNLDGSYTFTIINLPPDVDSDDFQITVFDEILEQTCYPVTIQYLIILIIIIVLLIIVYIKKYNKQYKILLWLILIVWIVYIILRYLGILCYEFL